jgi:hypothetical protein
VRTSVRGLPALLTDTERATPTMARGALSVFVCTCGCAESGGDCSCWMRCSGDGASRGADDGCELSAESLVTVGCAFESARLRVETGVVCDRVGAAGFAQISHSGSRSSRCNFVGTPEAVRPTTRVMESVSESKLVAEVGVTESFCTVKFTEALDLRGGTMLVAAGFLTKSSWALFQSDSARENVW